MTKSPQSERQFGPGEFLFHEGDLSNSMFLIKKGAVGIRKMKGGSYIDLGKLYSNEVLGELSFFDRKPRSAAAIALTEVEALEISFESLDTIYAKVPPYLKTIMATVADRLRKANDMIRRLQREVVSSAPDGATASGMSAKQALEATTKLTDAPAAVEIPSDIPLGSLDTSEDPPEDDPEQKS